MKQFVRGETWFSRHRHDRAKHKNRDSRDRHNRSSPDFELISLVTNGAGIPRGAAAEWLQEPTEPFGDLVPPAHSLSGDCCENEFAG